MKNGRRQQCLPLSVEETRLKVEFQSELHFARVLRPCNDSHPGSKAVRWRRQIHIVEGIQEISAELKLLGLGKREVLLQADICVHVSRPNDRTLRRAIAERTCRGRRKRARIKPQHAHTAGGLRIVNRTVAIWARRWRTRS